MFEDYFDGYSHYVTLNVGCWSQSDLTKLIQAVITGGYWLQPLTAERLFFFTNRNR
jgi:hypothetical protein